MKSSCADLRLYNQEGEGLSIPDPLTFSTPGSYFIMIAMKPNVAPGAYEFYLESTNQPSASTLIAYDQVINGTLTAPMEMDVFPFNGTVGDRIDARLQGDWQRYPRLILYREDGTLLKSNAEYWSAEFNYVLPSTGTFFLGVDDNERDNTGNYSVYLTRLNPPQNATPIEYGQVVSGNCTRPLELIPYSFTVNAGDSVRFWMKSTGADLRLYNKDGEGLSIPDPLTFTTPGTYYLVVAMKPNVAPGEYQFYLESTNQSSSSSAIAYDQVINETLATPLEMDIFPFNGMVGDRIDARLQASWERYPRLTLYREDGSSLISSA